MPETLQTEGHALCPTGRPLSPSPEPTPSQTPSLQTGEALGNSTPLLISEAEGLPQGKREPGVSRHPASLLNGQSQQRLPWSRKINSEPQNTARLVLSSGQLRLCAFTPKLSSRPPLSLMACRWGWLQALLLLAILIAIQSQDLGLSVQTSLLHLAHA